MKKILMLAILAISAVAASAVTLKETFDRIAAIDGFSSEIPINNGLSFSTSADISNVVTTYSAGNGQEASANICDYVMELLSQQPISSMLIGGKNSQVLGVVYAAPNEMGQYDLLIVALAPCGGGFMGALYGSCNETTKNLIADGSFKVDQCKLYLEVLNADLTRDYLININY